MIYTLTTNLAIDLFIETNDMKPNFVNRTNYFEYSANGKGVNVSLVLKQLGIESVVTGFRAGFTGDFIKKEMDRMGINNYIPEVEGTTRINVFTKVVNEGIEYNQVNPGPEISENAKLDLLNYLKENLQKDDILTINGSFPEGVNQEYIEKICEIAMENGTKIVIDNSSNFVPKLAKYRPFLIKPNENEICAWFNEEVEDKDQFIRLAKQLIEDGFQNILLSLGADGALFINSEEILHANAPTGEVVNTAMSGDTLLATFISEKINNKSNADALKKSVAAGSSTAFREGLTDFSDVSDLEKEIKITYLGGKI